jgi:NADPH:quinone reductase-like Zn-dependent oxidoreductase
MPGTESPSIGELPAVGDVPKRMWAQVIRQGRFGEPQTAFRVEEVDVPPLASDQVLVAVMAAGINFNNVWAGEPVLVWGGSGGLGTQAIQLAAAAGARPVAVVSDDQRGEYVFGNRVALVGTREPGLGRN